MKYYLSALLLLLACLLGYRQPSSGSSFFVELQKQHQTNVERRKRIDLIQFFDRYNAATPYPITAYLNASEQYQIDFRLLPAISIAESSGGRHACGNNWWGWASCQGRSFGSVAEGIQFVSEQLSGGDYYRGKTIDQKLRAYNPNPQYAPRVLKLMREIAPNP